MNGIEKILRKTDLNRIQRLSYKYNTFNDVKFEAFSKFAYAPMWHSQFQ